MIDYLSWSQEYEKQAQTIQNRVNELIELRRKATTPEELLNLNERITKLRSILYEHKITIKLLRKRGEKYYTSHNFTR